MAVCNNYKYLYQYINKKLNNLTILSNSITALNTRIGTVDTRVSTLASTVSSNTKRIASLESLYSSITGLAGSTSNYVTSSVLDTKLAALDNKYFNKTTGDTITAGKSITFAGTTSSPTISYSGSKMAFVNSLATSTYGFKMGSKEIILGVKDGSSYVSVDEVDANTIKVTNLEVVNLSSNNFTGSISWDQIIDAPDVDIPENVSEFNNDAGYITSSEMETAMNNWANNFTSSLGSRYVIRDSDGITITTGSSTTNVKITNTGISRTIDGETQWAVFGDVESIPLDDIEALELHYD